MKLKLLDEVLLKDGTKGKVVEFDKSPLGYDVCLRTNNIFGISIRQWIRRDHVATVNGKCLTCGGAGFITQLDKNGESNETVECAACHPAYSTKQ